MLCRLDCKDDQLTKQVTPRGIFEPVCPDYRFRFSQFLCVYLLWSWNDNEQLPLLVREFSPVGVVEVYSSFVFQNGTRGKSPIILFWFYLEKVPINQRYDISTC